MICYLQEILFKYEERRAESTSLSKNRPFNILKGKEFHKAIYTNIRKKQQTLQQRLLPERFQNDKRISS